MGLMTNECMLRVYKRDGKETSVGGDETKKRVFVRNVWNSREMVEIEVEGVKLELVGVDLVTAVQNALRVPQL